MTTASRALLATRLLYPAHRTRCITSRMQDRLAAQQQRARQPRGIVAALIAIRAFI